MDSICKGNVSSPLVPDNAGYLAFFTRAVEQLKEGAEKVGELVEVGSRDLLVQVLTSVFSRLFRSDPDFDFNVVIALVPIVIRDALSEWVEDHVDALSTQFTPNDREGQRMAEGLGDDDNDGGSDGDDDSGGDASS